MLCLTGIYELIELIECICVDDASKIQRLAMSVYTQY